MNNEKSPLYRRVLDMLAQTGRNAMNVNERGKQRIDAERARNESMMRDNGLQDIRPRRYNAVPKDRTVPLPRYSEARREVLEGKQPKGTQPNQMLFDNPLPFAPQMANFMRRLQATRSKN